MKPIYVKDGDTVVFIAKMEPSVSDPALEIPGVAQAFRVIANSYGPTLLLVPEVSVPTKLSQDRYRDEQNTKYEELNFRA